ncbi:thiol reductant ABC exporter subunit CydC [Bacillus lacus]|uniref:Thiol reductant ABC exporter subunit CydC n=1 Tax=Metabacillus lacus TaxID=1983721 RepID=A0A7X2J0Y9_9BACI|nr:thiol reductant ABC exporter subunit CydC [Metabacillus lacus]MRX73442.1 thiol reductant ABC exporter subunit CydC [Metabacillus lacus]
MKELLIITRLLLQEKRDVLLSVLFGVLAGLATVSLFANSGYLIAKAAITPPLYILTISIALLKFFSILKAAALYMERLISHRATFTMLSNARVHFFQQLEGKGFSILQKYNSGDLLARIVGDVESLQNFFLRIFYPPLVMLIVFLSTIAFTLYFSVYIALLLLGGFLLTGLLIPLLFSWRQKMGSRNMRQIRGKLSGELAELFYGYRDLKIHQQLQGTGEEIESASRSYIQQQEKERIQVLSSQSVNTMAAAVITWLVLLTGAFLTAAGELNGVYLAMLVMISLTVFETTGPMAAFPAHYEDNRVASQRLFRLQGQAEKRTEESVKQLESHSAPSITFHNVSFTHDGEARPAAQNISFRIPAGSKTAIVGPSGSGKSTLLQLILKMYDEYDGSISMNEELLSDIDRESIWTLTNPLLQERHFFSGTIRDNLLLAKENISDRELMSALEKAELSYVSLNTILEEKGDNLSGGEKQRLDLARAFLKGGRLWLLDEPTSSLDSVTEGAVFEHIFQEAEEDTVILVSHRLQGLEKMDHILVMENGKLIEEGSYQELMQRRSYFYEMKKIEDSLFMV